MTNQKGGVRKKNNAISDADALRSMITNSVSNKAISYGSLKCFVWVFDIAPANSEYNDINIKTGQLNRPVTKYVIKVVITNPNRSRDMSNPYVDPITRTAHDKSSDSINSLVEEANTQQLAWIKTFSQGVYVECPSVASLCFFDNQNGRNFVNFLRNHFGSNNMNDNNDNIKRTNYICQYLLNQLNYNPPNINNNIHGIAVILMPLVGEEEVGAETATLHDFLNFPIGYNFNGWIINQTQKDAAFSSIIAAVIRLFIAGIIHMDLHGKNSLIYYTRDRRLHCKVLDFGNSSIFTDNNDDNFLNKQEKSQLAGLLAQNKSKFLQYKNDATDAQQKIALITDVMNEIQLMDRRANTRRFNTGYSQMGMWWNIIRDNSFNDVNRRNKIIEEAYNIARRGEESSQTQRGPSEATLSHSVTFPFIYNRSAWSVNAPSQQPRVQGQGQQPRVQVQPGQQRVLAQKQQPIPTYIKVGALGVLLAACGYGVAKATGYLGGGDETTKDIEDFIKDNDLTQILEDIEKNDVCPINIEEKQKEALSQLVEMLKQVPPDATIELSGPQEAGRGKRRRSRKMRKAKKTRRTRRIKKHRKTRRR